MTPRVLGIDISDASTNLVYYTEEESYRFPTVICRQKNGEAWFVGEEAYGNALSGNGVVTDKLLSLTGRQGTATLGGIKYEGRELLKLFLEIILG